MRLFAGGRTGYSSPDDLGGVLLSLLLVSLPFFFSPSLEDFELEVIPEGERWSVA